MNIPRPGGKKCPYCGKPVYDYDRHIAAKPKKGGWTYAHSECAVRKGGARS